MGFVGRIPNIKCVSSVKNRDAAFCGVLVSKRSLICRHSNSELWKLSFQQQQNFFSWINQCFVFLVFLNIDSGFWSVTTPHLPVDLIDNSLCLSGEHQHLFLPWFEQHPDYFETIQNIISNQTQWDAPRQSGSRLACWSVEPWVSRAPAPTLRLLLLSSSIIPRGDVTRAVTNETLVRWARVQSVCIPGHISAAGARLSADRKSLTK